MAEIFKPYRQESKTNWGVYLDEKTPICREQIQLGAILRIADATEKMAENYGVLIRERDRLKKDIQYQDDKIKIFHHRIAGLKGYIKRMKK